MTPSRTCRSVNGSIILCSSDMRRIQLSGLTDIHVSFNIGGLPVEPVPVTCKYTGVQANPVFPYRERYLQPAIIFSLLWQPPKLCRLQTIFCQYQSRDGI